MYDRILIPVDGSEVSNHALEDGLNLAAALGSRVTLLFVVDMTIVAMPEAELGISNIDVLRRSFVEQGEKVVKKAEETAASKGISFESIVSEGDVHNEIISVAENKDVDLIIMGTHGRRGLNRLLLGSVAESVSKRAHCAVLLIRPR